MMFLSMLFICVTSVKCIEKQEKLQGLEKEDTIGLRKYYEDVYLHKEDFFHGVKSDEVSAYAQLCSNIYNSSLETDASEEILYKKSIIDPVVDTFTSVQSLLESTERKFIECNRKNEENCLVKFKKDMLTILGVGDKEVAFESAQAALKFSKKEFAKIELKIEDVKAKKNDLSDIKLRNLSRYPIFNTGYFQSYEVKKALYRNGKEFSGAVIYNQTTNHIIISYAGTKTYFDIVKDLYIFPGRGDTYFGVFQGLRISKGTRDLYLESAKDMLEAIHQIYQSIDQDQRKNIHFTTCGHSLGGALAILAAYHIKESFLQSYGIPQAKIRCVNFGCPRVFSKDSASKVEKSLGKGNILRFWNVLDIIPAVVSGTLTNSRHVGLSIRLESSIFHDWYIPIVPQHLIDYYYKLTDGFKAMKDKVAEFNKIKNLKVDGKILVEIEKNSKALVKEYENMAEDPLLEGFVVMETTLQKNAFVFEKLKAESSENMTTVYEKFMNYLEDMFDNEQSFIEECARVDKLISEIKPMTIRASVGLQ